MCHLSIEKSLKGLYSKKLHEVPPKTHNLIYLLNKIGKKPDQKLEKFFLWFFRFSRTRQFML
ncbi:MAG: HEPN domain-containing protein [Deltaproteobacteria bacterium]|nr:HEPN domain-containing protein [Deltaproteobacteria bacterium]